MSRTAQVKKDARVGEAEARRDATIRVSSDYNTIICTVLLFSMANILTTPSLYSPLTFAVGLSRLRTGERRRK